MLFAEGDLTIMRPDLFRGDNNVPSVGLASGFDQRLQGHHQTLH